MIRVFRHQIYVSGTSLELRDECRVSRTNLMFGGVLLGFEDEF